MNKTSHLQQAISFLQTHGNEIELARLAFLTDGQSASEEIVGRLLAGQRPDGSWAPFWAPDYGSLDATCFRLAQAEQLGLDGSHKAIIKAVAFLESRQLSDGHWEEDQSVANVAPPWVTPGDVGASIYLTANCGFWSALWGQIGQGRAAGRWLATHAQPSGEMDSFPHAHWLAAAVWQLTDEQAFAKRTLSYLATRLSALSANQLSWLLTTLMAANVPHSHEFMHEAAIHLHALQQADGRWPSDDAHERDAHVTVEALRALQYASPQS